MPQWKGGEFQTGHKANGFMKRLNWLGKTFHKTIDQKSFPRKTVIDGVKLHHK